VPLVAALAGGWLAVKAVLDKGPTVTITFRTAEGIEAGKTRIRYRDIDIGGVTQVALREDAEAVIVTAELAKEAARLLVEDSRFWVVRPRITGGGVSGLGTLLTSLASLTGKDTTLTGRTGIWWILAEHIELRPFFGSGYAAYWTAGPMLGTESHEFVRRMQGFYPGSAHNGYLEVANDLGWVGLTGLLGYAAMHVRQSLQLLRLERSQAVLYLAIFFQQAITNLSESHWFSVLSVDFVIMTLASTALARSLLEHRLRGAFGDPAARAWQAGTA